MRDISPAITIAAGCVMLLGYLALLYMAFIGRSRSKDLKIVVVGMFTLVLPVLRRLLEVLGDSFD